MTKVKKKSLPPELDRLSQQVGEFMQYWGFKKIHGMIWVHLWLSEKPLDAKDLIQRLGVSKALISISIKDLLKYNVILEQGKSNLGTILYSANPQVMDVILNVIRSREKRMLADIESSFKLLKDISTDEKKNLSIDAKKLKALGQMIKESQNTLSTILSLGEMNLNCWQEIDFPENEAVVN